MTNTAPILVVTELRKSYNEVVTLKGVGLTAPRGATTVPIGRSGAGKTTLLRPIVALARVTSGSFVVDVALASLEGDCA